MILSFTLTMPNVGSWNGKWTGEGNLYAKVINFGRGKAATEAAYKILSEYGGYYYYSFGDGWGAGIRVREVDADEARSIRRKSKGFCGYEWMIESIRSVGRIEVKVSK